MALKAPDNEALARIATIAEAVVRQFGADAIRVAEHQAEGASGDVAESWYAVVDYLETHDPGI